MAKYWEGEERGVLKGSNASCLPPRFPTFPNRGMPSFDLGTGLSNQQSNTSFNRGQRQHHRTPSCNIVMQDQPPWLDDLLDDSEAPPSNKKGSHRRSASDSFTYLESAGSLYMFSNIAEEDESECVDVPSQPVQRMTSLDGADSHQLTNLWEEIQILQNQQKAPISSRLTQPVSYMSENSSASTIRKDLQIPSKARAFLEGSRVPLITRPEPARSDDDGLPNQDNKSGNAILLMDPMDDPKRAKRVLANRQSAQRSRVRKLQYIAELETTVNALQAEVASISPQVVYFEHQRALLNMDNAALKQQLTICMRDKKFKDFQNEALKKDIQRLQKLYQIQLLHQEQGQQQPLKQQLPSPQLQRLHRHSSLPTDLGVQTHTYNEHNQGLLQAKNDYSFPDSLDGFMKNFANISLTAGSSSETSEGLFNGSSAGSELLEGKSAAKSVHREFDIPLQKL